MVLGFYAIKLVCSGKWPRLQTALGPGLSCPSAFPVSRIRS